LNSLFDAKNSLFRVEQGIWHSPLKSQGEKGLPGAETSSKQGKFENALFSGRFEEAMGRFLGLAGE
jgi:hypothetical protein